ncbi:MAG: butyrate kinase [Gemmatimonadota bacterium]
MDPGALFRILVVNPGSTSTRAAFFRGETGQAITTLPAPRSDSFADLWDEFPSRLEAIREWLGQQGIEKAELSAVVGRGGLLRPVEGGTFLVTEAMLADARGNRQGSHASNLGCALARALADEATRDRAKLSQKEMAEVPLSAGAVPAFVVDPVSTDEFGELARYSGLPEIPRRSLSHALSIHALVQEVCKRAGRGVEGSRFVVAHLGGGISVCPVCDGRILDANNANSGGPFSPTRAGGLPTQELLALCFSGKYTLRELKEMTVMRGGLVSYLGTDDAREVEGRIEGGDVEARRVYEAMAYQIAKEIGAMATVLNGKVERVLLTGGLAASDLLTAWIRERVGFLAPVEVWPEVEEMKALALGALRVLKGEIQAKEY